MMIDKRLIGTVPESKRYIAANVALQWAALVANIVLMACATDLLQALYSGSTSKGRLYGVLGLAVAALVARFGCTYAASRMSYRAAKTVKKTLRGLIFEKLLKLGSAYRDHVNTSEVVQVAVEGVDQLETYFGAYLPQFFYAMLAPLTLFIVLLFFCGPAAAVLLICVPLIPVSIAAVQTWAKKLLAKYWDKYTALGDTFLENLQGLTTLKIYNADAQRQTRMNEEAEEFRKITMRVLTMQLNSITIMDLVAYGGAALGIAVAVSQVRAGRLDFAGCIFVILLAADFFLPMRQLGSFFHIAMNGMAASGKIFKLLDLPDGAEGCENFPQTGDFVLKNVHFGYEESRDVLQGVDLTLPRGSFTALVGESGCGKSTLAALLMGRSKGYRGSITVGGVELRDIDEASLLREMTYIGHQSHLFAGTVRDNLRMGAPKATDAQLWESLQAARLDEFLRQEQGLDTVLTENAANLSGGQRQRLALARALLHDSPVYIFDEATSNIDEESENAIMAQIHALAKTHTVLLISHRLANVVGADRIVVLDGGHMVESGTHAELLAHGGHYAKLWQAQQQLERYTGEDIA